MPSRTASAISRRPSPRSDSPPDRPSAKPEGEYACAVLAILRTTSTPTVAPRATQKSRRMRQSLLSRPRRVLGLPLPAPCIAERTPYVKAATLTTGEPNVAAKSDVRALTFVVIDETLAVMVSSRTICSLVEATVLVTCESSGTVCSETQRTPIRASSRTLPALPMRLPRRRTRKANDSAATTPATSPMDTGATLIHSHLTSDVSTTDTDHDRSQNPTR